MSNPAASEPHRVRAVIAVGMCGSSIVMSTDSEWMAEEVSLLGAGTDDVGIDVRGRSPGVYLWEGTMRATRDGDTVYEGEMRLLQRGQLELLGMEPDAARYDAYYQGRRPVMRSSE